LYKPEICPEGMTCVVCL